MAPNEAGDERVAQLCEDAWSAFTECADLLEDTALRSAAPSLYVHQTVECFREQVELEAAVELLSAGGADGLSVAQALSDAFLSLRLALHLAADSAAAGALAAVQVAQVALCRAEKRIQSILALFELLRQAGGGGDSWPVALESWRLEEIIASGDLAVFWREHFPRRLRASADDVLAALGVSRALDARTCRELRLWLRPGASEAAGAAEAGAGEEVELSDVSMLFDCWGIASGIAFCTHWEELLGHQYITAVCAQGERGARAAMCAADIALGRRERMSSVLLPGWSRERLRGSRPLLLALRSFGMVVACDSDAGLVVQFSEPEVAARLASADAGGGGGARARLAEAATASAPGGALGDVHFVAAGETPSQLMQKSLEGTARPARERHALLTELKGSRLEVLNDLINELEVLGERRRSAAELRARRVDPLAQCDAVPKMQEAERQQLERIEEVTRRKQRLLAMERSCDDPDQVAHLRALMQEVAEAEAEQEDARKWLEKQNEMWMLQSERFQQARRRQDLGCRQRVAAILLELKLLHQKRLSVSAEVARIENMLLDLEEETSSSRQWWHEYDERLWDAVQDSERLLADLSQAMTRVRAQIEEADANTLERASELEALRRIMELQANKAQQLDEIDILERKLAALTSKSPAAAAAAVSAGNAGAAVAV